MTLRQGRGSRVADHHQLAGGTAALVVANAAEAGSGARVGNARRGTPPSSAAASPDRHGADSRQHGYRVTVLERDPEVETDAAADAFAHWERRGAPQVRHLASSSAACATSSATSIRRRLVRAGARELRATDRRRSRWCRWRRRPATRISSSRCAAPPSRCCDTRPGLGRAEPARGALSSASSPTPVARRVRGVRIASVRRTTARR